VLEEASGWIRLGLNEAAQGLIELDENRRIESFKIMSDSLRAGVLALLSKKDQVALITSLVPVGAHYGTFRAMSEDARLIVIDLDEEIRIDLVTSLNKRNRQQILPMLCLPPNEMARIMDSMDDAELDLTLQGMIPSQQALHVSLMDKASIFNLLRRWGMHKLDMASVLTVALRQHGRPWDDARGGSSRGLDNSNKAKRGGGAKSGWGAVRDREGWLTELLLLHSSLEIQVGILVGMEPRLQDEALNHESIKMTHRANLVFMMGFPSALSTLDRMHARLREETLEAMTEKQRVKISSKQLENLQELVGCIEELTETEEVLLPANPSPNPNPNSNLNPLCRLSDETSSVENFKSLK